MDPTTTKRTPAWQARPSDDPPAPSVPVFVCAECRHAQLFAVQPRILCTCRECPMHGQVLYAGRPACAQVLPRKHADPSPRPTTGRRGGRGKAGPLGGTHEA